MSEEVVVPPLEKAPKSESVYKPVASAMGTVGGKMPRYPTPKKIKAKNVVASEEKKDPAISVGYDGDYKKIARELEEEEREALDAGLTVKGHGQDIVHSLVEEVLEEDDSEKKDSEKDSEKKDLSNLI